MSAEPRPALVRLLSSRILYLTVAVLVMWFVEIVDNELLDSTLQRGGIHPRRIDGLDGIFWTPWLHSDYGHVLSNSVPFIMLGWLVSLRGVRHLLAITAAVMIGGGGLTWLLAGGSNHIGASGIVFGFFGALLGNASNDRRPNQLAPALVAILFYGTLLAGLVPQDAVSWEGHLFGFIVGFFVARWLTEQSVDQVDEDADAPMYPWELDEPWLRQPPEDER